MINVDRKWIMIDPTMVLDKGYPAPEINEPWTNNSFINNCRLLRAEKYHILCPQLQETKADAYLLISVIDNNLDEEIEFVKKVHKDGGKVVLAISADARYNTGIGLMCLKTGTVFTDLCDEVDAICSGVSNNLHIFGKNQYKVVEVGDFVEKLNFNIIPFENRTIDILSTGFTDEASLSFSIILFLMLKEKYPEKRFVYAFRNTPQYDRIYDLVSKKYPQIEFTRKSMKEVLSISKCYVNLEPRPRGGRALLEAWQYRVPFISYNLTYYSKLFPDFTYSNISFDFLLELYEKVLSSNYNDIIKKSEEIMEYDYADKVYERIINILDRKK